MALYLHEDLDLGAAVRYWSEVTSIPPTQFSKPYRARHENGCLSVRYYCSRTHRRIIGLIEALLGNPSCID